LIALVLGAVFGPFSSSGESYMQTVSVITEIEEEYTAMIEKQMQEYEYQEVEYRGSMSEWSLVLSLYTVKNNLIADSAVDFDFMYGFDSQDIKNIFWEINSISSYIEERVEINKRTEIDKNGNLMEIEEEINIVCLVIESVSMTASEAANFYGFSDDQKDVLYDLVAPRNAGLWHAFIPPDRYSHLENK
jgi:hypothetical protein